MATKSSYRRNDSFGWFTKLYQELRFNTNLTNEEFLLLSDLLSCGFENRFVEINQSEYARVLGKYRQGIHRLLTSLESKGFIERNGPIVDLAKTLSRLEGCNTHVNMGITECKHHVDKQVDKHVINDFLPIN